MKELTLVQDFWGPSKRLLGEMTFLQQLKDFDKDNIKPEVMVKIRRDYIPHKLFIPQIVAKASSAAEGLCKWIIAMDMYDKVAREVAPKRAKLDLAEREYQATMAILNQKKELVLQLEERLRNLNELLDEANAKQADLQGSVDLCESKLERAEKLIGGLGGERQRWTTTADALQAQYDGLAGDMLISCGVIAYLSMLTSGYRLKVIGDWHQETRRKLIPCSEDYEFAKILGVEVQIQNWYVNSPKRNGNFPNKSRCVSISGTSTCITHH